MSTSTAATLYRWSELSTDAPASGASRDRLFGGHATLARVQLKKGVFVPSHQHESEQFVVVFSGRVRFGLDEHDTPGSGRGEVVEPGMVLHLPPNVWHSAEALEDSDVLDIFSPPAMTSGIDQA